MLHIIIEYAQSFVNKTAVNKQIIPWFMGMRLTKSKLVYVVFTWDDIERHRPQDTNPAITKKWVGCWPPKLCIVCLMTVMQYVYCIICSMCRYGILYSLSSQHVYWWSGAYLAPGHLRPSLWRRPVKVSLEPRNLMNQIAEPKWWRHQMETFSALLAICAGNSPVTEEFPA